MKQLFDFGDISKCEQTMRQTWGEFRTSLSNGQFSYNQVDQALNSTFLKVFNDLFNVNAGKQFFSKTVHQVCGASDELVRGAILSEGEPVLYDRFIPKKEYIKCDNRFSPSGLEWLYLALGKKTDIKCDFTLAEQCSIHECRAKKGDRFVVCSFHIDSAFYNNKVVDLTIAKNDSYDQLNDNLEQYGQNHRTRGVQDFLTKGIPVRTHRAEFIAHFLKWSAYTYARLLDEQIFVPIETVNKENIYAPFQCLSQYFITLGYVGIIYSSTVFPHASNVVFFNKDIARPVGHIKETII